MPKPKPISTKEELNVKEVRTVKTDDEANKLLLDGWILLSSGIRHEDMTGFQAKVYFILARKE